MVGFTIFKGVRGQLGISKGHLCAHSNSNSNAYVVKGRFPKNEKWLGGQMSHFESEILDVFCPFFFFFFFF